MDGWILNVKVSVTAVNSGSAAAGHLGSRAWAWFQALPSPVCRALCGYWGDWWPSRDP